MFSKPTALIFAPLLLAYIVLIDCERPVSRILRSIPALVLSGAFLLLEKAMTPPTFFHTTIKSFDYWITQPYVTLRCFRSFFLPLYLNIDTDLQAFHSLGTLPRWPALAFARYWSLRLSSPRESGVAPDLFRTVVVPHRPHSYCLYPLNEVENDHRMFLPFVGLSLAVVWAGALLARRRAMVDSHP